MASVRHVPYHFPTCENQTTTQRPSRFFPRPLLLSPCYVSPRRYCHVAPRGSLRDYEVDSEGPRETSRPGFIRDPYIQPARASDVNSDFVFIKEARPKKRRRNGRRATPVTSLQAAMGAGISGCCSVLLLRSVLDFLSFLRENPLVRNAPLGLTHEANDLFLTLVGGFGGLAVAMFGFTGLGLALLAFKNGTSQNNVNP